MSKQTSLKYGVGIDIGSEEFYVCMSVIDQSQQIKIKATTKFKNTSKGFEEFYKWVNNHQKEALPVQYLMEATGIYYEQLGLFLSQKGCYLTVILPQKAKYYIKALGIKTKTDSVDAQALATMVCQQHLPAWKPIGEEIYKLRQLTRQNIYLQELRSQLRNQLLATELSMFVCKEVKKHLEKLIKEVEKQVDDCYVLIQKSIESNPEWERKVAQVCAIKGVGLLTVANLISETNEFEMFENQRQLVSYAGYDVVQNQSGKRAGKTRISKRGNNRIRRALHMSALQVVKYDQKPFSDLYNRVFERTKIKMKGYTAVQRKLLTIVYSLWKKDEKYDPNFQPIVEEKVAPHKEATLHQPIQVVLENVKILELA